METHLFLLLREMHWWPANTMQILKLVTIKKISLKLNQLQNLK